MLFAQPRQATNAVARAELCYINLASSDHSLQATRVYSACTNGGRKNLESRSGHGLNNRTGSAGPEVAYRVHAVLLTGNCSGCLQELQSSQFALNAFKMYDA